MVVEYIALVAALEVVGVVFGLEGRFLLWLGIFASLVAPRIIYLSVDRRRQQRRFTEASAYAEHVLYIFKSNRKVLQSMVETEPLFEGTRMGEALSEGEKVMVEDSGDEGIVKALDGIQRRYPYDFLRLMHRFLLRAEAIGGDIETSVDLLQTERQMWVSRVNLLEKERETKRRGVVLSIGASVMLTLLMDRSFPGDVSVTGALPVQISSLVMLVADVLLFSMALRASSPDFCSDDKVMDEGRIMESLDEVRGFGGARVFKSVLKGLLAGALLAAGGVYLEAYVLLAAAAAAPVLAFALPFLRYASHRRRLGREMAVRFPHWLLEVSLILPSTTVRNAVRLSYEGADALLKPYVGELIDGFDDDPVSAGPYMAFASEYRLPEISSGMKMLYGVCRGAGDGAASIEEIVERSALLLDKAKKEADADKLSVMYLLFLAPQLVAGTKILVDMCVFFVAFFANMSV